MGDTLRVLTVNLWNDHTDAEAFGRLVAEHRPDVVCVQELASACAEALAAELPHGRLEPDEPYLGMGIATRHPVRMERIPLAYRDARVAWLDPQHWPGLSAPLEIVNAHVISPGPWGPLRRRRIRRAQTRGLLEHIDAAPERRRVLLGDLNATPIWPVYRGIASRLEDAVARHARERGSRLTPTWPCWFGRPLLRIDHCFTSGLAVEQVEVVPLPGSDHAAVRVDLAVG